MPRSPPLFICSSPGPDPYDSNSNSNLNSNQNIYEELDNNRMESDDDSTIPCESFNKSSSENTTVASIYRDSAEPTTQVERPPRQYLVEGTSTLTHNHNNNGNNFRYKTETKKSRNRKPRINTFSMENLKNQGETSIPQLPSTYSQPYQAYCINSDLNRINNNFPVSTNSRKCCTLTNPSQMEIERRNRINMLFNAQSKSPVVHMNGASHFDGINNNSQHVYEDTIFYDSNRPNILPDFTTIRNFSNYRTESPSFGRDSSFSGDSGYSQNSNRSYFGRRKV
jgi:hypothetical protein